MWLSTMVVSGKARASSGQFQDLRMIDHRVETQLPRCQRRQGRAEIRVLHEAARHGITAGVELFVCVPFGGEANAAEASAAGCDLRIEALARSRHPL